MMKPKFDDVIEYVRAGENDPDLKKLLEDHPDGKELLKQARFICRMLDREVGKGRRKYGPAIAAMHAALDRAAEPTEMTLRSMSSEFGVSKQTLRGPRGRGDNQPPEELGTLELAFDEKRVSLSFEPVEQDDEPLSFLADLEPPKLGLAAVHIIGRNIRLSLPQFVPVGEFLTMQLSFGARQMPARRQTMVFMPESGAFLKLRADEQGRIDMPVPEQPGTLRIDTTITELLRVRLRK